MSISDYLENVLLNLAFGGTAWPSKPATLYFALYTAPPTDAGGGTQVSGGGYSRKSVAVNGTNFSVTGMAATTLVDLSFPAATAAWGTVTHFGIFDAASGGNLLFWGALGAEKVVAIGDTLTIGLGTFTCTFGGNMGAKLGNQLAEHIFKGTAFTSAGTHYFALGTAATDSSITGEGSGNGYARASYANNPANWPAAAAGVKANGAAVQFATASGAWGGPFTHFVIVAHGSTPLSDAISSSNAIWYGQLDQARTPANTDAPKFTAGDFRITLD